MTENQKPQSGLDTGLAEPRSLATMVDASLKRGSSLSIALSDATVGVNLDNLGDWTITVGLSSRSDRFHQITSSLESLGFFQATENKVPNTCFGHLYSQKLETSGSMLNRFSYWL